MWHSVWMIFCFICARCVYLSCLYPCMCSCCMPIIRRFVPPTHDMCEWATSFCCCYVVFLCFFFKYSSDPFFEVCRPHISDESEIKVTEGLTWVVRITWWVRGKRMSNSFSLFFFVRRQLSHILFCSPCIGVPSFETIWIRLVLMHLFSSACMHVFGYVCRCMSVLAHFAINIHDYMLATGIWLYGSLLLVCVFIFFRLLFLFLIIWGWHPLDLSSCLPFIAMGRIHGASVSAER